MAMTMAVSSAPCRELVPAPSPTLSTTISWEPPKVEDCPDGEDGQSLNCQSISSLITPTTSETSFELDTDDQKDEVPHYEETTNVPPEQRKKTWDTTTQLGSNKPNTSAPLSRRSLASQHSRSKISRNDAVRVTPECPQTGHEVTQQGDAIHLKSHDHGPTSKLPPHPAVPRITPAILMSTVFPHTCSSSLPSLTTSSTASSCRSTSPTMTSPPVSPSGRPKVRFSNRGPPIIHSHGRSSIVSHRPSESLPPTEVLNDHDIEQSWGVLFDSEGSPTPRLGRVLRCLASRLITCFGAAGDDVVTPEVMRSLYSKFSLHDDVFPFHDIFQYPQFTSISHLYQNLDCSYHLVQDSPRSVPTIPGLTKEGFCLWLTTNILAYPDQEHRRLNKLLASIQRLRVKDGTELEQVLPSQLPRQLLPSVCDKKKKRILGMAIQDIIEDYEHYVLGPTPKREPSVSPVPGRWARYTYPSESRITRYAVTRSKSDVRASSVRPISFDSRIRERSPRPVNRFATSVPNVSRSTLRSTHHLCRTNRTHDQEEPGMLRVPNSRHRSRRSDNPTYEDYFSHSTSRRRDSDSSLERPVTTSHGTSDRRGREKG